MSKKNSFDIYFDVHTPILSCCTCVNSSFLYKHTNAVELIHPTFISASFTPFSLSLPACQCLPSPLVSSRVGRSSCARGASDRRESCPDFISYRAAAKDQRAGERFEETKASSFSLFQLKLRKFASKFVCCSRGDDLRRG